MSNMDVARPYAAVSPTLDGEVLRVLAGTTRVLTGREVAALTGRRSHSGVLDALHRLAEHGLVNRVELNRAYLFTLNRDHLATPAVEALMGMRTELFRRIRVALDSWRIEPVHVSMFGSAARGDGDTGSDIDLFVIRPSSVSEEDPTWQTQLAALRDHIEMWTGNHVQVVELSEEEVMELAGQERPIVVGLRSDAIPLYGVELAALIGST